ncbi:MAG TPA: carbohydrate porin [Candidatus Acidoferrum sp.]|jgi:high affinity Mn2+ porin|nr:carbohydrate porin [Candidatus Acidoferrum sp.]
MVHTNTVSEHRSAAPLLGMIASIVVLIGAAAGETSIDALDGRDGRSLQGLRPSAAAQQRLAIHGQATFGEQWTDGFDAPYAGPNSLSPSSSRETVDVTLFLGARLWAGAEFWVTPEIDQGFGLDNTLGVAGFPSGLAYKVGANTPYFRLPRAFVRQTINEGGESESVEGLAGQLAGFRSQNRWVFTVGKFAVTDVFDTNQYAHDPRADFLNWAILDTGTFDYAADAWGYTVGAAAERYAGVWTFRLGVFDLSDVPNSESLEHGLHEFHLVGEIERRYRLLGQTGRFLVTAFNTRGGMGLLDQAIALGLATGTTPNPSAVREYRSRPGVGVNLEQPITPDFGLFARAGKAAGSVEVYEFADIDRSVAVGGSLKGTRWRRPDDSVGIAFVDSGISALREEYLNHGGLGILVGDGRLPHPGAEQILETYYNVSLVSWLHVSLDYQWVKNPAYNRDRGPVSVFALRVHGQF